MRRLDARVRLELLGGDPPRAPPRTSSATRSAAARRRRRARRGASCSCAAPARSDAAERGDASSSVSPPTKRAAPRRIPYRSTKRRSRGLSAAPRIAAAEQRLRLPGARGRAAASSSARSSVGQPPERRPDVLADRHASPDEHVLERRVAREAVDLGPQRAGVDVLAADGGGDDARESADASAETAPTAPAAHPRRDQRLGSDEDVEPFDQVRLGSCSHGAVGDLQPGQVRRAARAGARRRRAGPRSRS